MTRGELPPSPPDRDLYPAAQYQANPLDTPDTEQIRSTLQDIAEHCAAAAAEQNATVPLGCDVLFVAPADGAPEVFVREYANGRQDTPASLSRLFPTRVTDTTRHLIDGVNRILSEPITDDSDELADCSGKVIKRLTPRSPVFCTLLPTSATQLPTCEDAVSPDWTAPTPPASSAASAPSAAGAHAQEQSTSQADTSTPLRVLLDILTMDVDMLCQLHISFAYAVDGTPVTSAHARIQRPFAPELIAVADGDATPAPHMGADCTLRLFALEESTTSDVRDALQTAAAKLRPCLPADITPALTWSGTDFKWTLRHLCYGYGHKPSENAPTGLCQSFETLAPWLTFPEIPDCLAAGLRPPTAHSPFAHRYQARTQSDEPPITDRLRFEEDGGYPLGRDPATGIPLALEGTPRRHAIHTDTTQQRRILLTTYIEASRRLRPGPTVIIDYTGELMQRYYSQFAPDTHSIALDTHACLPIGTTTLADGPRQTNTTTTPSIGRTTNMNTTTAKELYHSLLNTHNHIAETPFDTDEHRRAKSHLASVLDGFATFTDTDITHSRLLNEITHHTHTNTHTDSRPQSTAADSHCADTPASAAAQLLNHLTTTIPDDLWGNLSATLAAIADCPAESLIWLPLNTLDAPTTALATTLLLDALARRLPDLGGPDNARPTATIVLDNLTPIHPTPITTAIVTPTTNAIFNPNLALVTGVDTDIPPTQRTPDLTAPTTDTLTTIATTQPLPSHLTQLPHTDIPLHHPTRGAVTLPKTHDESSPHSLAPVKLPFSSEANTDDLPDSITQRLTEHGETLTPDSPDPPLTTPPDTPLAIHQSRRPHHNHPEPSDTKNTKNTKNTTDDTTSSTQRVLTDYTTEPSDTNT